MIGSTSIGPQQFTTIQEKISMPELPYWSYYDTVDIPAYSSFGWTIAFDWDECYYYLKEIGCIYFNGIYNNYPILRLYKNGIEKYTWQYPQEKGLATFGDMESMSFTYLDNLTTIAYNVASITFTCAITWNFYRSHI